MTRFVGGYKRKLNQYQIKGQPEMQPWLTTGAKFSKLLTTHDKLLLLFYLSIDGNIRRLEYFLVLLIMLMYSNSIFSLLKRVTYESFLFSCKTLVIFLPFLNLDAQIRCAQNQYTDLKLALDQPLSLPKNLHFVSHELDIYKF